MLEGGWLFDSMLIFSALDYYGRSERFRHCCVLIGRLIVALSLISGHMIDISKIGTK